MAQVEFSLLSVNVGLPRPIGTKDGEIVLSGIAKTAVTADRVDVCATNIEGDAQADLRVHGGIDKAIYAYPADHWLWWSGEHCLSCRPATFGENLTLRGADENVIAIGDRFRWGDVVLEVCQPRAPCFKLAMHTARADVPQLMTISARSGWYLRVIEAGSAPVKDARIERVHESGGPTVRDAFVAALHPHFPREFLLRVHDAPALASRWRDAVARRLRETH